jgi:hypothetical protein
MALGSRRLLQDLDLVGRIVRHRVSARERLETELGPLMVRKLLDEDGGRPSSAAARSRPRRVA